VVLDKPEKAAATLLQQLNAIRNVKAEKRRQASNRWDCGCPSPIHALGQPCFFSASLPCQSLSHTVLDVFTKAFRAYKTLCV